MDGNNNVITSSLASCFCFRLSTVAQITWGVESLKVSRCCGTILLVVAEERPLMIILHFVSEAPLSLARQGLLIIINIPVSEPLCI